MDPNGVVDVANGVVDVVNNATSSISIALLLVFFFVDFVFQLLRFLGWLPSRLQKRFDKNNANSTIAVLTELGLNIPRARRALIQNSFYGKIYPQFLQRKLTLNDAVRKDLNKYHKKHAVYVGTNPRITTLKSYIDLMGAVCNNDEAEHYAKCLATFFTYLLENGYIMDNLDFIITPKVGSPILGYEFAKLIDKPLILHESRPRFELSDGTHPFDASFCTLTIPPVKQRALIIDDSVTGGSLVCAAIEDLRRNGYEVEHCIVVFKVEGGLAEKRLSELGVKLHSITVIPQKTLAKKTTYSEKVTVDS